MCKLSLEIETVILLSVSPTKKCFQNFVVMFCHHVLIGYVAALTNSRKIKRKSVRRQKPVTDYLGHLRRNNVFKRASWVKTDPQSAKKTPCIPRMLQRLSPSIPWCRVDPTQKQFLASCHLFIPPTRRADEFVNAIQQYQTSRQSAPKKNALSPANYAFHLQFTPCHVNSRNVSRYAG